MTSTKNPVRSPNRQSSLYAGKRKSEFIPVESCYILLFPCLKDYLNIMIVVPQFGKAQQVVLGLIEFSVYQKFFKEIQIEVNTGLFLQPGSCMSRKIRPLFTRDICKAINSLQENIQGQRAESHMWATSVYFLSFRNCNRMIESSLSEKTSCSTLMIWEPERLYAKGLAVKINEFHGWTPSKG